MAEGVEFPIDIPIDDGGVGDLVAALRELDVTLRKVGLNETKAEREIKQTNRALNEQGKAAKLAGTGIGGIGSMLKGIAAAQAFQVITQGVGMAKAAFDSVVGTANEFLDKLAQAERSRGVLKNVFGDVEGQGVIDFINQVSGKTEFTRVQLRGFASDLGRAGLSGEKLARAIAAGLDVSALSGNAEQGFSQFVDQIKQLAGNGQVGEEIFKLLGRGAGAKSGKAAFFDALSARTGKSIERLKEDLQLGKVKIDDSLEAINTLITAKTGKGLGDAGTKGGLATQLKNLRELPEIFIDNLASSDLGSRVGEGLGKVVAMLSPGGAIGDAIGGGLATVVDIGVAALDKLPAVLGQVSSFMGPVIDVGKQIWNVLKALWPVVQPLVSGLGSLLVGALKGVALAFQMVAGYISIAAPMFTPLTTVIGGIVGALGDMMGMAATAYSATVGPIVEIATKLTSFVGSLYQIGADAVMGFVNGIKAKFAEAVNAVADLGDSIVGSLKSVLGIASPSRVFMGFGRMTAQGFEAGLSAEAGGIESAINDTFAVAPVEVSAGFSAGADLMPDASASVAPSLSASGSAGGISPSFNSSSNNVTVNVDVSVTEPGSTAQEIAEKIQALLPGSIQSALERLAAGAPA